MLVDPDVSMTVERALPAEMDALTVNAVLMAVRQAANVMCDRWSLLTLLLAQSGVSRFSDFSARSGMANRLLTGRLAMLEEQEIMVRLPYMRRPVRYEYRLTHMGLELFDVFAAMARWEQTWHGEPGGTGLRIEHHSCGQASVLPAAQCAACAAPMASRDIWLTVSQKSIEKMPAKLTAHRRSTLNAAHRGSLEKMPLIHALDVFGDKWGIELVMGLFTRVRRFGDFQAQLGIATNILSERLARLQALGILRQTTDEDRHGRGAYTLCPKGVDLYLILLAIQVWADKWLRDRLRSPVKFLHRPCGQPLSVRAVCDHCGQPLSRDNSRIWIE